MASIGGLGINRIIVTIGILISGILIVAMAPEFVGYCTETANDANITGTVSALMYNLVLPLLWGVAGVACVAGGIYGLMKGGK